MAEDSTGARSRAAFNECMRMVEILIKKKDAQGAFLKIQEARDLNPQSPYILAFEERLKVLTLEESAKRPGGHGGQNIISGPKQVFAQVPVESGDPGSLNNGPQPPVDSTLAAQSFRDDQIRQEYEERIANMRELLESEYALRLEEGLKTSEERLRAEFAATERDLKAEFTRRMERDREIQQQAIESRLQQEYASKAFEERSAFAMREKQLVEQFDLELASRLEEHALKSKNQMTETKQREMEAVRAKLAEEYAAARERERLDFQARYEALQEQLDRSIAEEHLKLEGLFQERLKEQIDRIAAEQAKEYENRRIQLHAEIEESYRQVTENRVAEERRRAQEEAKAAFEGEKECLTKEFAAALAKETERTKRTRTEVKAEMEERFVQKMAVLSDQFEKKLELLGAIVPPRLDERLELYRRRMLVEYADGQPSVGRGTALMELKEMLELSFDQHAEVETSVRHELFVRTLEQSIIAGTFKAHDTERIMELKKRFGITPDEGQMVEQAMLMMFERLSTKAHLLVADDEPVIREELGKFLEDRGYRVLLAASVEEALQLLQTESPDLIVSDINFLPNQMNGFKFFQALRGDPKHCMTPFIFLSALTDDITVRFGVQLGIDDYLTKPVDFEMLLAVVEGKLRRVGVLRT